jgi:hypothetical protein
MARSSPADSLPVKYAREGNSLGPRSRDGAAAVKRSGLRHASRAQSSKALSYRRLELDMAVAYAAAGETGCNDRRGDHGV